MIHERELNACVTRRMRPGSWSDRLAEAVDCLLEHDTRFTRDAAQALADEYRLSQARPQRYRVMGVLVPLAPAR